MQFDSVSMMESGPFCTVHSTSTAIYLHTVANFTRLYKQSTKIRNHIAKHSHISAKMPSSMYWLVVLLVKVVVLICI